MSIRIRKQSKNKKKEDNENVSLRKKHMKFIVVYLKKKKGSVTDAFRIVSGIEFVDNIILK